jgi:small subunit ribosomal protein S7
MATKETTPAKETKKVAPAKEVVKKPVAKQSSAKPKGATKVEKKVEVKPKTEVKPAKVEKKVEKPATKPNSADVKKEAPATTESKDEEKKVEEIKKIVEPKKLSFSFKLFGRWDQDIIVADQGLKRYITLTPLLVPFSQGRTIGKQFWKSDKHIIERLISRLMVTGHKGKKHYRTSGYNTGKYTRIVKVVKDAFEIIERKTKKNPVEVYIRALENGSPREGVTTIEYGGVRYPKAVDLSPQRRIDLVLRWMCQGAFHAQAGRGKKATIASTLADQIMFAATADQKSNAIQKKFELERSSSASR